MNTCKVFWDDDKNKVAVAFVNGSGLTVDTVHYADMGQDFSLDMVNWVANSVMCWPGWNRLLEG
jgi:hypothetical protein